MCVHSCSCVYDLNTLQRTHTIACVVILKNTNSTPPTFFLHRGRCGYDTLKFAVHTPDPLPYVPIGLPPVNEAIDEGKDESGQDADVVEAKSAITSEIEEDTTRKNLERLRQEHERLAAEARQAVLEAQEISKPNPPAATPENETPKEKLERVRREQQLIAQKVALAKVKQKRPRRHVSNTHGQGHRRPQKSTRSSRRAKATRGRASTQETSRGATSG